MIPDDVLLAALAIGALVGFVLVMPVLAIALILVFVFVFTLWGVADFVLSVIRGNR